MKIIIFISCSLFLVSCNRTGAAESVLAAAGPTPYDICTTSQNSCVDNCTNNPKPLPPNCTIPPECLKGFFNLPPYCYDYFNSPRDCKSCAQKCNDAHNDCMNNISSSFQPPSFPSNPQLPSDCDQCDKDCYKTFCLSTNANACDDAYIRSCLGIKCGNGKDKCLASIPTPHMFFIGDSVTAGYGWTSYNFPMYAIDSGFVQHLIGINVNAWKGLGNCSPDKAYINNTNCSNNQNDPTGTTASIAYSFQFGKFLRDGGVPNVKISNLAVSGATPAHWDENLVPGDVSKLPGSLSSVIDSQISTDPGTNNFVVLTLGANPLLSRWLRLQMANTAGQVLGFRGEAVEADGFNVDKGICLNDVAAAHQCMSDDIRDFKMKEHFVNIYKKLLIKNNVLVQKYYHLCPWLFGQTGSVPDSIDAADPTQYSSQGWTHCTGKMKSLAEHIIDQVNSTIDEAVRDPAVQAVSTQYGHRIAAICPGNVAAPDGTCNLFDGHVYGDPDPWEIYLDTGIHPNIKGHKVLALGVLRGMCEKFGFFCSIKQPFDYSPGKPLDPPFVKGARRFYCADEVGGTWIQTCLSDARASNQRGDVRGNGALCYELPDGTRWMTASCSAYGSNVEGFNVLEPLNWLNITNCSDIGNINGSLCRGRCPPIPGQCQI